MYPWIQQKTLLKKYTDVSTAMLQSSSEHGTTATQLYLYTKQGCTLRSKYRCYGTAKFSSKYKVVQSSSSVLQGHLGVVSGDVPGLGSLLAPNSCGMTRWLRCRHSNGFQLSAMNVPRSRFSSFSCSAAIIQKASLMRRMSSRLTRSSIDVSSHAGRCSSPHTCFAMADFRL